MAQARVTDYFNRNKKAAGARKGRKPIADEVAVITEKEGRTRSRQTRSTGRGSTAGTARKSVEPLHGVQEEFLRVIAEASAPDPVQPESPHRETRPELQDSKEPQEPPAVFLTPRTPKRSSSEAGVDLSSAAEQHSTAKKRLLTGEKQPGSGQAPAPAPEQRKSTARKKLQLTKVQQAPDVAPPTSDPRPRPQPAHKETSHVVSKSPSNNPAKSKKHLSKEELVSLKSRLQKLRDQTESVSSASPVSVSTLAELKAQLDQAREISARVQTREISAQSGNQPQQSPAKTEDGDQLPGYQRFHTLAQDVAGLSLPYKYKLLAEMFRSMETIVSMVFNRSETVTFTKVKQGVQDMMHKRFEETHVGQIKRVYPSAYTFRQERNIPNFNTHTKKSAYQLTVEPNIPEETSGGRPVLSATRLLERRRVFHQNLIQIVKEHHKVFLASLEPPLVVPDDKLTRWHPKFSVDQVPNIQPDHLPQPPRTQTLTTAQEVLDQARTLLTPKMEKALTNMALKTAKEPETPKTPERPPAQTPQTPSALKGVSQSLLERIRAKEAEKLQVMMTRRPEQERRVAMMSSLPEISRILRNVFVAEKKPALVMEVACNRLVASYRSSLTTGEMEKHLRLLAQLVPDWLTIHPIRKDFYLKLNKNASMTCVLEKLSQRIREEERV